MIKSPDKLRAELSDAWIASIGDLAKARTADVPARIHELRVVEYVEEFGTDFERHGFLDGNYLRDTQIGVVEARTMEESTVRRAEASAIATNQNTRRT
jgi:hypothetical protein